ncbi:DUF2169 family type VI secretion system accessory protein [Bordetella genomosp. 9]|uniref:DUF2169 domain-containing protein n=1 Tax=Bordetella genomosp. 9 TaxID=1416803 RepID=A0A1W6Z358_9BORD|nr:DUF2169 domain-containing protein [Bordetella genomosp. 9]ARP87815.1 hypothetical protein CAL13_17550 [Bordetella genomosp. 9]
MKTIKPLRLSVLTRPYRWQRQDHLGVAVLALARLGDAPRLLPEQALWKLAGEETGGLLDIGMPKPYPEVLATGYAYTAHQKDRTSCAVRLKVEGIADKALLVFGDRYWLDGRPDAPRPFDAMRLDWSRAYGGPGVPENPLGIGAADEMVNGVRVRRVPNIESPDARLSGASQRPAPAGYGPYGMDWPQRARHMGSRYDQEWLENDFPGFAPDMDPRYFNAAPEDQRAARPEAVLAGAAYEVWNMHPERQVLRGRLPDWRARCFASRSADGAGLEEIGLGLSTAWFFPHRDCVVLIWHGRMPLQEDDAADIRLIMPALECAGQPRATAHYESVLARRLDPGRGALHAMVNADLVPAGLCDPWLDGEGRSEADRPSRRNLRKGAERRHAAARADLVAQGLDPDRYLAPLPPEEPPPSLADLPDRIERMEMEMAQARRGEGVTAAAYAQAGLDDLAAVAGVDMKALRAQDAGTPAPPFDFAALRRQLRQAQAQPWAAEAGGAKWDAMARQGMLHAGQYLAPPPMPPHRARRTRASLQARARATRDARGLHLAGADLSGMDLRGMDFRGAILAGADLSGACLDQCDFGEAVLAAARLDGASAREASFVRANLGGVRCGATDLRGADLSQARVDEAVFDGCDARGVRIDGGAASRALFRGCDFGEASLTQWTAMRTILERCRFAGARFDQCVMMETAVQDCDFAGARMTRAGFTQCAFAGAKQFAGADLEGCAFAGGADLSDACFAGARIRHSSLRGAVLDRADLSGARLEAADFSECRLHGADLSHAEAPRSLFVRADLRDASLRGARLIETVLPKSILLGTCLDEANLFRADVAMARMDATTSLRGAYTKGAKRYPLYRAEPTA